MKVVDRAHWKFVRKPPISPKLSIFNMSSFKNLSESAHFEIYSLQLLLWLSLYRSIFAFSIRIKWTIWSEGGQLTMLLNVCGYEYMCGCIVQHCCVVLANAHQLSVKNEKSFTQTVKYVLWWEFIPFSLLWASEDSTRLNPVMPAYDRRRTFDALDQYTGSPGHTAYCYAELAVSSQALVNSLSVLVLPTQQGIPGWVGLGDWLKYRGGMPAIPILTGPSVE